MANEQLERSILDRKERDELHAIAEAMALKPGARSKKSDIIDQILQATGVDGARRRSGNGTAAADQRRRHRPMRSPLETSDRRAPSKLADGRERHAAVRPRRDLGRPQRPATGTPAVEVTTAMAMSNGSSNAEARPRDRSPRRIETSSLASPAVSSCECRERSMRGSSASAQYDCGRAANESGNGRTATATRRQRQCQQPAPERLYQRRSKSADRWPDRGGQPSQPTSARPRARADRRAAGQVPVTRRRSKVSSCP